MQENIAASRMTAHHLIALRSSEDRWIRKTGATYQHIRQTVKFFCLVAES